MKNQYVGDINDYRKYALLRHLSDSSRFRLGVCWMLTADDNRTDGGKVEYLSSPGKWRRFDPELFDILRDCVAARRRHVEAIEQSGCLPGAVYHSTLVTDDRNLRISYFEEAKQRLSPAALVFFDPDNGLEVRSCRLGNRNSSKYLYWHELDSFYRSGKSVLVFQHFIREKRTIFVKRLMEELTTRLAPGEVFAFLTPNVVFLLAAQPARVGWFEDRIHLLQPAWPTDQILPL
jgi:hypothetical protein